MDYNSDSVERECARCGSNWKPLHRHHTYLRRNNDETIDLCYECHHWVHMNPAKAKEEGFMKDFKGLNLWKYDND